MTTVFFSNYIEKVEVPKLFYGYAGEVLHIDLSNRKISKEKLKSEIIRDFLGGLGFAIKTLYDEVGPSVAPFDSNNLIVIAPGALTGTSAPSCGRTEITTKSPITGILGTGNFGGFFGSALKKAGYDAIVIRNTSQEPVYLKIEDDLVEILSAMDLWRRDAWETTDTLKREMGKETSVMAIGQAGENLVKFACPVVDYYHVSGRAGSGAVMGKKKLKAIAVRGTKDIPVARPREYEKAVKEATERIRGFPAWEQTRELGNFSVFEKGWGSSGDLCAKNWQTGVLSKTQIENFKADRVKKYLKRGSDFCFNCPLNNYLNVCSLKAEVKKGRYAGLNIGGVVYPVSEMEFGVKGGLLTHEAVWKCKELCQRYGMDVGTPIPFAIELFQRGIISEKDTDGLKLEWGDEEAYCELLRKIAFREGFGDTLAEGTLGAAKIIGRHAEEYMAAIKGMEMLSDRDPRTIGVDAFSLGWLTCPRGGDNVKTTHDLPEVHHQQFRSNFGMSKEEYTNWFIKRLDMFKEVKEKVYGTPPNLDKITLEGNVALAKWYEEVSCIFNSLGFCMFTSYPYVALGPSYYAKLYSTCTGIDKSPLELMTCGERIFNLMKAYIVREGITEKDDVWPTKFFRDPLPEGPLKGAILDKTEFDRALNLYYEMRRWDKTGVPTREKLEELNLHKVAHELRRPSEKPS